MIDWVVVFEYMNEFDASGFFSIENIVYWVIQQASSDSVHFPILGNKNASKATQRYALQ